jgi:Protein of unknown function (DUF2442)
MSTATLTEPRIVSVDVTDDAIVARLADGRVVSVPLEWSWRLKDATPEQRGHWEIIGDGQGVHWPDVDEDISVQGMLRGVPAKRPSRAEMRILFDASALIDIEHAKPVSFADLDKMLREHHARLVVTCTSINEFAAPRFEKTDDRLALRDQLQQLEHLPIGYLREGGIVLGELREAIQAFNENRECVSINPYVRRWDETLVPEGPSPVGMLVNQSLYDLVAMALSRGDVFRRAIRKWEDPLREQFEADRKLPAQSRRKTEQHFRQALRKHLDFCRISFPRDREKEIAGWIYADPVARCPGYRLAWEWREELMNNLTEKVSKNDIPDRAHVLAVPYVDAITMDANTADLCRRVARRLRAKNPAINYEERIFTSLKELLDAKF